jgi:hypothetical protein
MTIDTSTDALLEEAEAIVRAEWMRLHRGIALRDREFVGTCAEMPAARICATPVLVTVALDERGARQAGGRGQWPPRRRPRSVWPSQRSPPQHNDAD